MAILERLGRSLDPNLDILSKASHVLLGEALLIVLNSHHPPGYCHSGGRLWM